MPRSVEVREVPGVEAALATRDPARCARAIAAILTSGEDRKEVVRTAALASARRFAPALPPSAALPALGASLTLAVPAGDAAIAQACALAASAWGDVNLAPPPGAVVGDEIHLARSWTGAVRGGDAEEADAIFSGLLREGDERRLAGDALFEACAQDLAGDAAKLPFAVASWRLGRALGWVRGSALLRPAVRVAAMRPQDLADHSVILREVGRARFDLELAARNTAEVDATARNTYGIALGAGQDRVVADLIAGLKRGRTPAAYADLVAASAAERLVEEPAALPATMYALAVRFVLGFSRAASHTLAVVQAARMLAKVKAPPPLEPVRVPDTEVGFRDLLAAIQAGRAREASRLALGLMDASEPETVAANLAATAATMDATKDGGRRLVYAAWAVEFSSVAPGPALASLAAVLARP